MVIKRGDLFYADLRPSVGSEQDGVRPVLVIQNDTGNKHGKTTIIVPVTTRPVKNNQPTHVKIRYELTRCTINGVVLAEQTRAIDKSRLKEKLGHLSNDKMEEVNRALQVSLCIWESNEQLVW